MFGACVSSGMGILEACRVVGTPWALSEQVVRRWAKCWFLWHPDISRRRNRWQAWKGVRIGPRKTSKVDLSHFWPKSLSFLHLGQISGSLFWTMTGQIWPYKTRCPGWRRHVTRMCVGPVSLYGCMRSVSPNYIPSRKKWNKYIHWPTGTTSGSNSSLGLFYSNYLSPELRI